MADKDAIEIFKSLLSDIEDEDAKALRASLQPQVLASQAANVPVPLAPPPTYNVVPGVGLPPAVDVGQINIPQPMTPQVAPLPNPDNFNLRPPEQVVFGKSAQGLPEKVVPESSGPYQVPDVPKYQIELNAPPVVRGEDQSQFEADVEGLSRNINTRVLYDQAIQPLASGGLPSKGGMSSTPILGSGFINRTKGYFTDTIEDEKARELSGKAREYFDRDDVRESIEADPEALALLQRDPIGYYLSLTSDTVDKFVEEQPFTFEKEVPKPEGDGIPKLKDTDTQPAATGTQSAATGTGTSEVENNNDENTNANAQQGNKNLDASAKETINVAIENSKNGERKGGKADDTEEEGFFKSLWNGVKGLFTDAYEDPALRKTLIAYIASKAAGFDGGTFAAQVLENEYQKDLKKKERELSEADKLAERQHDLNLKVLESELAANKDLAPDYSSPTHVINPEGKKISGVYSKGKTRFYPDNPEDFPMTESGGYPLNYDVQTLRASDSYKFEGASREDNTATLTDYIVGRKAEVIEEVLDQEAPNLESEEEEKLKARLSAATSNQTYRTAVVTFMDMIGNADVTRADVQSLLDNAHLEYMRGIANDRDGTQGGSKVLAAYMNLFHLKNTNVDQVSDQFFKASRDSKEMMPIGFKSWAEADRAANRFRQALAADLKTDPKNISMPATWQALETAFNRQAAEQGEDFLEFWEGEAKSSLKKTDMQASPAILWVTSLGQTPKQNAKFFPGSMKEFLKKFKAE